MYLKGKNLLLGFFSIKSILDKFGENDGGSHGVLFLILYLKQ